MTPSISPGVQFLVNQIRGGQSQRQPIPTNMPMRAQRPPQMDAQAQLAAAMGNTRAMPPGAGFAGAMGSVRPLPDDNQFRALQAALGGFGDGRQQPMPTKPMQVSQQAPQSGAAFGGAMQMPAQQGMPPNAWRGQRMAGPIRQVAPMRGQLPPSLVARLRALGGPSV